MPTRPPVHNARGKAPSPEAPRPRRHDPRGSAASRGYGHKWRQASKGYLRKHPLCVHCLAENLVTTATVVDHIKPHRGDQSLFWDSEGNWQPLCKTHHDRKTVLEDGGFGRERKAR